MSGICRRKAGNSYGPLRQGQHRKLLPNVEEIYVSKFLMRTSTWQGSNLLVHTPDT